MLERKKKNLNTYNARFNMAVAAITDIIDILTQTSANIEDTIMEIDEYTNELAHTVKELNRTKEKNNRVIKNFSALIAE